MILNILLLFLIGEVIYDLGKPDPKSIQKSPSLESGLLNMRLDQKVNFIEKVGRWIYVGFETGRVSVYDLTKVIISSNIIVEC